MKIFSFDKLTKLEIITSLILVVYLFVDLEPPKIAKTILGNKYGLGLLGLILLLLICYSNPLVTILFIFAAYELVRKVTNEGFEEEEEEEEDYEGEELEEEGGEEEEMMEEEFTNEGDGSLENNIVGEMAPVGKGSKMDYKMTGYKPVEGDLKGTSLAM